MIEEQKREEYLRLLRQSFLLQGAPPDAAERLLATGWHCQSFVKGQIIFGQDPGTPYLLLLVSGRAKAQAGESLLLRAFSRGDIFGAAALFAAAAEPFSLVVAESAGELLLLPLIPVRQLIQSEPQVAENYIRFLAQRIAFLNRKIASLSGGEAGKRLAAHIAAAAGTDGVGRPVFSGNISRVAQMLNISRASLYRALAALTEAGILHREGKNIIIDDLARLTEY